MSEKHTQPGFPRTGVERIADERKRQIEQLDWTAEHDDDHSNGEIAMAAALYAAPRLLYERTSRANTFIFQDAWPWDERYDKRPFHDGGNVLMPNETLPTEKRIRQLEKAGAMIAGEIDRLLRTIEVTPPAEPKPEPPPFKPGDRVKLLGREFRVVLCAFDAGRRCWMNTLRADGEPVFAVAADCTLVPPDPAVEPNHGARLNREAMERHGKVQSLSEENVALRIRLADAERERDDWKHGADAEARAHDEARQERDAAIKRAEAAEGAVRREERSHEITINSRDYATDKADAMADILARLIDPACACPTEVIGEHSSGNCPWRQAIKLSERIAENQTLKCGHPTALLVRSVESDYQFCKLCETQDRLRDALTMEKELRNERDEERRLRELAARDHAELESAIRDALRPVLGAAVDGDGCAVPGLVELVERVVEQVAALRNVLERVDLLKGDTLWVFGVKDGVMIRFKDDAVLAWKAARDAALAGEASK